MKFTCESCSAQYMISDEKVGPSGVKVRCKKCGNVILVRRAAAATNGAMADAPSGAKPDGAASEPRAEAGGAAGAPAGAAPGLEAELGQAFDHAFGDTPPSTPAPGAAAAPAAAGDTAATQLMGSEDAAKVFSDRPAPTASDWYVAIGQAQVGPLPLVEVKKKWEVGDVGPDSLVWRPGMSDWAALSGVQELASYLAPFPRTTPQPARAAEPRMEMPGRVEAPTPAAAEPTWKPAGASALAALASEEIAARTAPEPKPAARPVQGAKALVDALPDGGGVDPTGALPLNIKALETVTDERKLERRSSLARGAEAARHRRSTTRAVVFGVALGAVLIAGAAVGGMVLYRKMTPPAQPVAVKPPPAAAVPLPPPPAAVTKPAAETTPAPAVAAATTPSQPPAPAAAKEPPAAAKEPPAPPPERHVASTRHKASRTEAPAKREVRKEQPQVASAEPEPASARRRSGGGLLDFESNDKALDEALGGKTGSGSRSVYVPPAASGGGALPAKVSPGEINAAVAARIDSLRKCVSEQKAREPEASGTLKMRWIIQGDGGVRDVKCLTSQYAKGAFAQCIEGVVKSIKFPRSTTTGQEVTFPFNF
jgi:predicted Zn finger-like uncharacterized protein